MGILLHIVPGAIGVAISPLAIVAIIATATGKRKASSFGFLIGWALALLAVGTIILATGVGAAVTNEGPNRMSVYVQLILGILLLLLALQNSWPKPKGHKTAPSRWAAKVDHMPGYVAFGLALLMAGTNAKNLALIAASMITIAQAGLTDSQSLVQLLYFVLIASAGLGLPLLLYAVAGDSVKKALLNFKSWLERHNGATLTILFLLLGGYIIIQAVVNLKVA
jgi:cytochrome b561